MIETNPYLWRWDRHGMWLPIPHHLSVKHHDLCSKDLHDSSGQVTTESAEKQVDEYQIDPVEAWQENETKICTELSFLLIYYHAALISISRE